MHCTGAPHTPHSYPQSTLTAPRFTVKKISCECHRMGTVLRATAGQLKPLPVKPSAPFRPASRCRKVPHQRRCQATPERPSYENPDQYNPMLNSDGSYTYRFYSSDSAVRASSPSSRGAVSATNAADQAEAGADGLPTTSTSPADSPQARAAQAPPSSSSSSSSPPPPPSIPAAAADLSAGSNEPFDQAAATGGKSSSFIVAASSSFEIDDSAAPAAEPTSGSGDGSEAGGSGSSTAADTNAIDEARESLLRAVASLDRGLQATVRARLFDCHDSNWIMHLFHPECCLHQ